MKFGKFVMYVDKGNAKNVFFDTDKGLSGVVKFAYGKAELGITAHFSQWGVFNPYAFDGEEYEGAPDKETCDEVIRVFENEKHLFEDGEQEMLESHKRIEENLKKLG